jgi:hypothetical protein
MTVMLVSENGSWICLLPKLIYGLGQATTNMLVPKIVHGHACFQEGFMESIKPGLLYSLPKMIHG